MNSYQCYSDYVALKQHFSRWDYDYFHFRGSTQVSPKSYDKRKDRYWFEKLSNLHSPFERLIANFCVNESAWIRDIVVNSDVYLEWQARQDTLTRTFTKEIEILSKSFDNNFLYNPGTHPFLVREYLGGRISLETLTIISDLTDCVSYWVTKVDDDPLFEMVIRRIMKYSPFLDYDMEKFREILIKTIES